MEAQLLPGMLRALLLVRTYPPPSQKHPKPSWGRVLTPHSSPASSPKAPNQQSRTLPLEPGVLSLWSSGPRLPSSQSAASSPRAPLSVGAAHVRGHHPGEQTSAWRICSLDRQFTALHAGRGGFHRRGLNLCRDRLVLGEFCGYNIQGPSPVVSSCP